MLCSPHLFVIYKINVILIKVVDWGMGNGQKAGNEEKRTRTDRHTSEGKGKGKEQSVTLKKKILNIADVIKTSP